MLADAHCHFFSTRFYAALGRGLNSRDPAAPEKLALDRLGWDPPGSAEELGERWAAELDRHGVTRAALIASVPGDAESVEIAVDRHPDRFVGFFMVDPTQPNALSATKDALDRGRLRGVCLFPAMHRYSIQDDRAKEVFAIAAARAGTAVFVHCGVLSVGVRNKLGLPSHFDMRFSNPLDVHGVALAYRDVPIIVPHFGAGMFREALMLADLCPNVLLDTSSSNGWIKYHPQLTLETVFRQALGVLGAGRLLFGSDSSFFPRGWVKDVFEQQSAVLNAIGASEDAKAQIFGATFDRLFPLRQ